MSEKNQKRLSYVIACVGAVFFAIFFGGPGPIADDGTVASAGIGGAVGLLVAGAIIYWTDRFILQRISGTSQESSSQ